MVEPHLIYFADPMCSWCYGFAPVMDRLLAAYAGKLDIRLVMGGLRPGKLAQTMTPAIGRVIRHHWREVAKMTGQIFDENFFDREGFLYDTEPAAKAVVTIERLSPENAYAYYHKIQAAFYAQNCDITSADELASAASEYGVATADFRKFYDSDEAQRETWAQFQYSAQLGIRGFPALVLERDNELLLVTRGWQPWENIEQTLNQLTQTGATAPSAGESCEVGGEC